MNSQLEMIFPRLRGPSYRVTSPSDRRYNCIAWAAGNSTDWWWPTPVGTSHWPVGVPRAWALDAFREAFATLGYAVCNSVALEPGFEKIAVYATAVGLPRHAERQLPDGRWSSKLGRMEDIEHDLEDLVGSIYGSVALLLRRQLLPPDALS